MNTINKICPACSKEFKTRNLKKQKYCNKKCRLIEENKRTGRVVLKEKIANNTVGAMSELFVAADLMKRGYNVFRAVSPSCFCDLIAIKNDNMLNIEVRTGYVNNNGSLCFPKNTRGKISCFGIYERNTSKVYYLDLDKKEFII